jgi:hypothetical protein
MASLAELVPRAMPKNEPAVARLARLVALWEKSVPHRVALEVTPVRTFGDTLFLHASSAVWAQQVSLLAPQLLASMRARDPKLGIARLAPRVGRMPPRLPVAPEPAPVVVPPLPVERLPADVRDALAKVADESLRASLTQAACSALALAATAKRR